MKFFLFSSFCLITSLTVLAQDFTVAVKQGVDLKTYDYFMVVLGEVISGTSQTVDKENFYKEIKPLIIREMEARGYKHTDSATAQLVVSYLAETSTRTDFQNYGPLGQSPTSNPALVNQSQSWSREFTQGTLIINLDDAKQKTTVWSSEGTMDISRARGGNLIEYSVRSAFKKLPDKTKKVKSSKKKK